MAMELSNWWFMVIVLMALILVARIATPTKEKQGTGFNSNSLRAETPPGDSMSNEVLTVATYNVQTGKSLNGVRDINKSAELIQTADVVGIQEVYAPSWLNLIGLGKPQTLALAQDKFDWLFSATRRRWLREHRGNALLSKFTVNNRKTINLPNKSRKAFRNMAVAEISWQNQTIHIINTHLHTGRGREQQLARVIEEFNKHQKVILMGDFNTKIDDQQLQAFIAQTNIKDAILEAGLDLGNANRIDWIITKGFSVLNGKFEPKGASDHPYYQVSLKLED